MRKLIFLSFLLLGISSHVSVLAQSQNVGLFQFDAELTEEGYTLWAPLFDSPIFLMDNCGNIVHSWENDFTLGNSCYLLEDGRLLRTANESGVNSVVQAGGAGQRVQIMDWDGNLEWDFVHTGDSFRAHHDIARLPNGNVLILTWEAINRSECIASGRDTAFLNEDMILSEGIYEVRQTGPTSGEIVWEWHLWDHLVQDHDPSKKNYGTPEDHPELMNLNYVQALSNNPGEADWIHSNALEYNPDLDQIMFSSQRLGEIYIIDHSTSTSEAADHAGGTYGKGGDFLYRWGNPEAYGHGTTADAQLFGLHNCYWIPEGHPDQGKIMIFNNGLYGRGYSTIDVIEPTISAPGVYELGADTTFGPAKPFWTYMAPDTFSFDSWFISGAQRLPNGNTLICSGANGHLFEVTYSGAKVWEYYNPHTYLGPIATTDTVPVNPAGLNGNLVFRALKYPTDYAGFFGRDLSVKGRVEADLESLDCVANVIFPPSMLVYPNPSSTVMNIDIDNLLGNGVTLTVYGMDGRRMYYDETPLPSQSIDVSLWRPGVYVVRLGDGQYSRFVKQR